MSVEKSHHFSTRIDPYNSRTHIFTAQFVQILMLMNHVQPKRVSLLLAWTSQQSRCHNPGIWQPVFMSDLLAETCDLIFKTLEDKIM